MKQMKGVISGFTAHCCVVRTQCQTHPKVMCAQGPGKGNERSRGEGGSLKLRENGAIKHEPKADTLP